MAYTIVPIDTLFAAVHHPDGGRAQSRTDRRAGAMALLFIGVSFMIVMLMVGLAVARLIHFGVTDLSTASAHLSR